MKVGIVFTYIRIKEGFGSIVIFLDVLNQTVIYSFIFLLLYRWQMGRVKLIVDSTADLQPELYELLDISVVPTYFIIESRAYPDTSDCGITREELYRRLRAGEIISTSQPNPSDFSNVYRRTIDDGYDELLVLTLPKEPLSGTYNSALVGINELEGKYERYKENINVVCTGTTSLGLGLLAMMAAMRLREGQPVKDLVEELKKDWIKRVRIYVGFDDLYNIAASGRVHELIKEIAKESPLLKHAPIESSQRIAPFLKKLSFFKPVISLVEGEVDFHGICRKRKSQLDKIIELIRGDIDEEFVGYVVYAFNELAAKKLARRISNEFTIGKLPIEDFLEERGRSDLIPRFGSVPYGIIGMTLTSLVGPTVFGVAFMSDRQKKE